MRLTRLSLTNFRNYTRLELPLPEGVIVLHGDNAQGKTSLLEAVYYLATSSSPHSTSDRQLINWLAEEETIPFARLVAEIDTKEGTKRIEVTLMHERTGPDRAGADLRLKKEIRVNGLPRRVMDLLGQVTVVLFLPHDLALVEGSPSLRRRYLNVTLCQTDPAYCQALSQYEKVLRQRNALLRQLQEQQFRKTRPDTSQLAFWDEKLSSSGAQIIAGRYRLVRELERKAQHIHRELSGKHEHLRLRYQPGFDPTPAPDGQMRFEAADLGPSALPQLPPEKIAAQFLRTLQSRWQGDIMRGMTTIGPQRDEMRFVVNSRDLGLYGSRGQNRTAVLALKLAELAWMRESTGEWPILLLDEVAAELDPHRRAYLVTHLNGAEQIMLTTTEPSLLPDPFFETAARWYVEGGHIRVEEG